MVSTWITAAWAMATLATQVTAIASYNPGAASYAVAVTPGNGTSSSSDSSASSDVYFQINAPTSYSWAALGIGSQMAGSHIFVMYADGNGNVTISGRSGTGHAEPQEDRDMQLQLLEGSGVVGDNMVANVLCSSCSSYLDSTTDQNSNWIAAWKVGNALNSMAGDADISRHDANRQFTLDLSQAAVSARGNPFVAAAATNASAAEPQSTSAATESDGEDEHNVMRYQRAHGIIMGIAVLILFPLGALFMLGFGGSVAHSASIHALLQSIPLLLFIAAYGLGVHLADITNQLFNNAHTRFGTAILILFVLQPIGGIIHHLRSNKSAVSTHRKLATGHRWLGRITIGLAVINGGLGIKLAGGPRWAKIVWGVIAGVVFLLYVVVALAKFIRERRKGHTTSTTIQHEKATSSTDEVPR